MIYHSLKFVIFQVLSGDANTATMGLIVLLCQLVMCSIVICFVIQKAKKQLDLDASKHMMTEVVVIPKNEKIEIR